MLVVVVVIGISDEDSMESDADDEDSLGSKDDDENEDGTVLSLAECLGPKTKLEPGNTIGLVFAVSMFKRSISNHSLSEL